MDYTYHSTRNCPKISRVKFQQKFFKKFTAVPLAAGNGGISSYFRLYQWETAVL